jgi:hypothetical protein
MAKMLKEKESYLISGRLYRPVERYEREGDLLIACKEWASAQDNVFLQRVECGGKLMGGAYIVSEMTGFPDLLAISEGHAYAAELKLPGKRLEEAQAKKIMAINERGGGRAGVVLSLSGFKRFVYDKSADAHLETPYGKIPMWY